MQNTRPTAASFGRIVTSLANTLATRQAGYWTSFMAGSAPVDVSVGYKDRTLYLGVDHCATYLETVAVSPNPDMEDPARWHVLGDHRINGERVAIGTFKTIEAALGFALERVCARNWYAGAQDQHDPVAI